MNCDISPTSSENYHLPEDRLLKKAIHLKLCDHQGWLFKKVEWIFWSNQEIDNFQNFLDEPLLIVGRREKCPLNIPITLRELHNIKKEALSTVSKKLSLVSKRNIYYGGGGLNYHAKISRSAFFLSLSAKENGFTETELEVCENSLNAIPNDYDFYFAVKNLPESAYEEAHEIFIEKLYSRFSFSHLDVTKIFHYLKKIQTKLQQKTLDNPYLEKIFRNVDLQPNHPFLFKILLKVDAFSIRKINKDNNQFIFRNLKTHLIKNRSEQSFDLVDLIDKQRKGQFFANSLVIKINKLLKNKLHSIVLKSGLKNLSQSFFDQTLKLIHRPFDHPLDEKDWITLITKISQNYRCKSLDLEEQSFNYLIAKLRENNQSIPSSLASFLKNESYSHFSQFSTGMVVTGYNTAVYLNSKLYFSESQELWRKIFNYLDQSISNTEVHFPLIEKIQIVLRNPDFLFIDLHALLHCLCYLLLNSNSIYKVYLTESEGHTKHIQLRIPTLPNHFVTLLFPFKISEFQHLFSLEKEILNSLKIIFEELIFFTDRSHSLDSIDRSNGKEEYGGELEKVIEESFHYEIKHDLLAKLRILMIEKYLKYNFNEKSLLKYLELYFIHCECLYKEEISFIDKLLEVCHLKNIFEGSLDIKKSFYQGNQEAFLQILLKIAQSKNRDHFHLAIQIFLKTASKVNLFPIKSFIIPWIEKLIHHSCFLDALESLKIFLHKEKKGLEKFKLLLWSGLQSEFISKDVRPTFFKFINGYFKNLRMAPAVNYSIKLQAGLMEYLKKLDDFGWHQEGLELLYFSLEHKILQPTPTLSQIWVNFFEHFTQKFMNNPWKLWGQLHLGNYYHLWHSISEGTRQPLLRKVLLALNKEENIKQVIQQFSDALTLPTKSFKLNEDLWDILREKCDKQKSLENFMNMMEVQCTKIIWKEESHLLNSFFHSDFKIYEPYLSNFLNYLDKFYFKYLTECIENLIYKTYEWFETSLVHTHEIIANKLLSLLEVLIIKIAYEESTQFEELFKSYQNLVKKRSYLPAFLFQPEHLQVLMEKNEKLLSFFLTSYHDHFQAIHSPLYFSHQAITLLEVGIKQELYHKEIYEWIYNLAKPSLELAREDKKNLLKTIFESIIGLYLGKNDWIGVKRWLSQNPLEESCYSHYYIKVMEKLLLNDELLHAKELIKKIFSWKAIIKGVTDHEWLHILELLLLKNEYFFICSLLNHSLKIWSDSFFEIADKAVFNLLKPLFKFHKSALSKYSIHLNEAFQIIHNFKFIHENNFVKLSSLISQSSDKSLKKQLISLFPFPNGILSKKIHVECWINAIMGFENYGHPHFIHQTLKIQNLLNELQRPSLISYQERFFTALLKGLIATIKRSTEGMYLELKGKKQIYKKQEILDILLKDIDMEIYNELLLSNPKDNFILFTEIWLLSENPEHQLSGIRSASLLVSSVALSWKQRNKVFEIIESYFSFMLCRKISPTLHRYLILLFEFIVGDYPSAIDPELSLTLLNEISVKGWLTLEIKAHCLLQLFKQKKMIRRPELIIQILKQLIRHPSLNILATLKECFSYPLMVNLLETSKLKSAYLTLERDYNATFKIHRAFVNNHHDLQIFKNAWQRMWLTRNIQIDSELFRFRWMDFERKAFKRMIFFQLFIIFDVAILVYSILWLCKRNNK